MRYSSTSYIPALRYHALTRFYDNVIYLTTREGTFKKALVQQIDPQANETLLDVGCGTGTLLQMLVRKQPKLKVVGLDIDISALEQASVKLKTHEETVTLFQGQAQKTSFANEMFDLVVSSLFFHHLNREQKLDSLCEIRRVLKLGGRLHIADWGRPKNCIQRCLFYPVQVLDGFETTSDNVKGELPKIINSAGFLEIEETKIIPTPLGTIRLLQAKK